MRTSGRVGLAGMLAAASIAMMGAGINAQVVNHAERGLSTAGQQGPQTPGDRAVTPSSFAASMRRLMGGHSSTRGSQRARGPGWTNAHAKRVARKARAVKAHRARSRG